MGWVAIDSAFYKELEKAGRPFTRMEAIFCLTHDMNLNYKNTIKGYSKMWQWSRHKVRKFLEEINTKQGCIKNGAKNQKGHPIRLIGNGSDGHRDTLKNTSNENKNQKGHPKTSNSNGFNNHRDTNGSKRTPLTLTASAFLESIGTPS